MHKSLDDEKRRKASHATSIEGKDSWNMRQGPWGGCHEKADSRGITLGPLVSHFWLESLAFELISVEKLWRGALPTVPGG